MQLIKCTDAFHGETILNSKGPCESSKLCVHFRFFRTWTHATTSTKIVIIKNLIWLSGHKRKPNRSTKPFIYFARVEEVHGIRESDAIAKCVFLYIGCSPVDDVTPRQIQCGAQKGAINVIRYAWSTPCVSRSRYTSHWQTSPTTLGRDRVAYARSRSLRWKMYSTERLSVFRQCRSRSWVSDFFRFERIWHVYCCWLPWPGTIFATMHWTFSHNLVSVQSAACTARPHITNVNVK